MLTSYADLTEATGLSQALAAATCVHKERAIEKIFSYPFAQVLAKINQDRTIAGDRIEESVIEFCKWMSLVALDNDELGMPSKDVDEVWHTFILFTPDYSAFCRDVFDGYLHHQPATPDTPIDSECGVRFRSAYERVFGPLPAVWGGALLSSCQERECSGSCKRYCCSR